MARPLLDRNRSYIERKLEYSTMRQNSNTDYGTDIEAKIMYHY